MGKSKLDSKSAPHPEVSRVVNVAEGTDKMFEQLNSMDGHSQERESQVQMNYKEKRRLERQAKFGTKSKAAKKVARHVSTTNAVQESGGAVAEGKVNGWMSKEKKELSKRTKEAMANDEPDFDGEKALEMNGKIEKVEVENSQEKDKKSKKTKEELREDALAKAQRKEEKKKRREAKKLEASKITGNAASVANDADMVMQSNNISDPLTSEKVHSKMDQSSSGNVDSLDGVRLQQAADTVLEQSTPPPLDKEEAKLRRREERAARKKAGKKQADMKAAQAAELAKKAEVVESGNQHAAGVEVDVDAMDKAERKRLRKEAKAVRRAAKLEAAQEQVQNGALEGQGSEEIENGAEAMELDTTIEQSQPKTGSSKVERKAAKLNDDLALQRALTDPDAMEIDNEVSADPARQNPSAEDLEAHGKWLSENKKMFLKGLGLKDAEDAYQAALAMQARESHADEQAKLKRKSGDEILPEHVVKRQRLEAGLATKPSRKLDTAAATRFIANGIGIRVTDELKEALAQAKSERDELNKAKTVETEANVSVPVAEPVAVEKPQKREKRKSQETDAEAKHKDKKRRKAEKVAVNAAPQAADSKITEQPTTGATTQPTNGNKSDRPVKRTKTKSTKNTTTSKVNPSIANELKIFNDKLADLATCNHQLTTLMDNFKATPPTLPIGKKGQGVKSEPEAAKNDSDSAESGTSEEDTDSDQPEKIKEETKHPTPSEPILPPPEWLLHLEPRMRATRDTPTPPKKRSASKLTKKSPLSATKPITAPVAKSKSDESSGSESESDSDPLSLLSARLKVASPSTSTSTSTTKPPKPALKTKKATTKPSKRITAEGSPIKPASTTDILPPTKKLRFAPVPQTFAADGKDESSIFHSVSKDAVSKQGLVEIPNTWATELGFLPINIAGVETAVAYSGEFIASKICGVAVGGLRVGVVDLGGGGGGMEKGRGWGRKKRLRLEERRGLVNVCLLERGKWRWSGVRG